MGSANPMMVEEPLSPAERIKVDRDRRASEVERPAISGDQPAPPDSDSKPVMDDGGIYGKTYFYCIRHKGNVLWRRYSDFETLLKDPEHIQRVLKSRGFMDELPRKHLTKSSGDPRVVAERKPRFEKILDTAWEHARECKALKIFLDPAVDPR